MCFYLESNLYHNLLFLSINTVLHSELKRLLKNISSGKKSTSGYLLFCAYTFDLISSITFQVLFKAKHRNTNI